MKHNLLICIACLLMLPSCGKPASQSSSLSSAEATDLANAFARLENALQTHTPIQYSRLLPGATPAEINQLRTALNGSTVEVLEKWFQWHNGAAASGCHLLPLGQAISINDSLSHRKMENTLPMIDGKRKTSVKILDDLAGDGFFIDTTSSKALVYYHMLEDPYPQYYGTLAEFVEFIAVGFEQGILYEDKNGNFAFDQKQYTAYEATHLSQATTP